MQNTVTQDFISAPKQKQTLSSFPFNKAADKILLQYVEKRLNKIFFDEVNSSDSIFKKVLSRKVSHFGVSDFETVIRHEEKMLLH